ncbi:DUF5623 domain-containing protein [Teredinibacter sp. KSP-S5-2]|uniref:DUF5623 domain-containing protein n=1 Tax=Teredinibacter sp. KSP-S5-2 TaxID=3034506 RepID=UPI0029347175|nr:DUF5623 domain-containing protein [Teredinibacter sp. KSP-S5-2]WNO10375.1 DUF5623 domain-containing protein [Teredinibacter sp. KSP-S5-2]
MLNDNIQPSTIGGIKRLAKQVKKANGVPHHEALDIAARSASFENFKHARKSLQNRTVIKSNTQLFFTVHWYDRETYESGRELLEVELSMPLLQIASKKEFERSSGLGRFRLASQDHFVCDEISESQDQARSRICKAVRVLKFIEVTGLKPSRDYKAACPNRDHNNKLPQADHSTYWYDPDCGQFILIDEPYLNPVVEGERAAWSKKYNWHLQSSKWAGMYYPGYSNMFVATDASTGYDFKGLMAKIDGIPYPLTAENWTGTSSEGHDTFYSPLAVTRQDKQRAVAKGTIYRVSGKKTQPMQNWNAPYNERRPNAVMSIQSHQLAAQLIKAVEHSSVIPPAVYNRLSHIKCKLEDWFFSEYSADVTNEYGFFYYGGIDANDPFLQRAQSLEGVAILLQQLKDILLDAYTDCEPLRKMIGKLDTSIKLTAKLLGK